MSSSAATSSSPPQWVGAFKEAMQEVYGPFDALAPEAASAWTPPPMLEGHRGRYLWTDAFGVVNFLTIHASTSDERYVCLAKRLVNAVHETLGRTRDLSARLPGATDERPLGGGLRIGKESESGPDGDGQYHHYLTIWMFALNRLSLATQSRFYNDQAITLAKAIHPRFMIDRDSPRPRMFWKMSMDLSKPLVASEGNLDPIDGYVVFSVLQETAKVLGTDEGKAEEGVLRKEIGEYNKILQTKWRRYGSDDPLDLGMTLWTAHWFDGKEEWASYLTQKAFRDLYALFIQGYFDLPTKYRLAFREFGTCLGIRSHHAADSGDEWDARARKILSSWEKVGLVPKPSPGRGHGTPEKLLPITLVMYATALQPGAFKKGFFNTEL